MRSGAVTHGSGCEREDFVHARVAGALREAPRIGRERVVQGGARTVPTAVLTIRLGCVGRASGFCGRVLSAEFGPEVVVLLAPVSLGP
jgi:hypothetical protein